LPRAPLMSTQPFVLSQIESGFIIYLLVGVGQLGVLLFGQVPVQGLNAGSNRFGALRMPRQRTQHWAPLPPLTGQQKYKLSRVS